MIPIKYSCVFAGILGLFTTSQSIAKSHTDRCDNLSLKLINSADIAGNKKFQNVLFGGVSGLDYDPVEREFLALSDDRGSHDSPRLYHLNITSKKHDAAWVEIKKTVFLTDRNGQKFATPDETGETVDPEAIRYNPAHHEVYWTSEGHAKKNIGPQIFVSKDRGKLSAPIAIPSVLTYDPDGATGPRPNNGFEGLSLSPDGISLWLGLEAPLQDEAPLPTINHGTLSSIFHHDLKTKSWTRYSYPLGPIYRQNEGLLADNGVSEILALGDDKLLVLERSGTQQPDKNFSFSTKIFCVQTPDRFESGAKQSGGTLLAKKEILALSSLGPIGNANYEAMTLAPLRPNGPTRLIVASDNNFDKSAATQFLVFAIKKGE